MPVFPKCISLDIEFNQHAVYYQSVDAWLDDETGGLDIEWVSDDERERARRTNSVWVCRWYPTTPVGFCRLAASSFDALMEALSKIDALQTR